MRNEHRLFDAVDATDIAAAELAVTDVTSGSTDCGQRAVEAYLDACTSLALSVLFATTHTLRQQTESAQLSVSPFNQVYERCARVADTGFLAVNPQLTLVINPVV